MDNKAIKKLTSAGCSQSVLGRLESGWYLDIVQELMIPLLLIEGFRSLMTQVSFLHYGGYWMKLPWSNAEWENRTSLSFRYIEMGVRPMSEIM